MLKFFRKIRQQLLSENNFSKYLLYAAGEILLVMIGILLALQVNNWNEEGKNKYKERFFLKGIKADLQQDTIELNQIIQRNRERLSYFKKIDTGFNFEMAEILEVSDSVLKWEYLFNRERSFQTTKGSYNSLISDGQSQLISNRSLFDEIQGIYEVELIHIESLYETIKEAEGNVKWKRTYEIRYPPYQTIVEAREDKTLLADLNYLHFAIGFYTSRLLLHKKRIRKTLQNIDNALKNSF